MYIYQEDAATVMYWAATAVAMLKCAEPKPSLFTVCLRKTCISSLNSEPVTKNPDYLTPACDVPPRSQSHSSSQCASVKPPFHLPSPGSLTTLHLIAIFKFSSPATARLSTINPIVHPLTWCLRVDRARNSPISLVYMNNLCSRPRWARPDTVLTVRLRS